MDGSSDEEESSRQDSNRQDQTSESIWTTEYDDGSDIYEDAIAHADPPEAHVLLDKAPPSFQSACAATEGEQNKCENGVDTVLATVTSLKQEIDRLRQRLGALEGTVRSRQVHSDITSDITCIIISFLQSNSSLTAMLKSKKTLLLFLVWPFLTHLLISAAGRLRR